MTDPTKRTASEGNIGRSMLVPQLVQWLARQQDVSDLGETTPRKPESVWENVKVGIPWLRKEVPINVKRLREQFMDKAATASKMEQPATDISRLPVEEKADASKPAKPTTESGLSSLPPTMKADRIEEMMNYIPNEDEQHKLYLRLRKQGIIDDETRRILIEREKASAQPVGVK